MAVSQDLRVSNGERATQYATTAGCLPERNIAKQTQSFYAPTTSRYTRPRPGRRRYQRFLPRTLTTLQLVICSLVVLSTFCVPVNATRSYQGRQRSRYGKLAQPLPRYEYIEPELELFKPGDIVYDRRFPVMPASNEIYKRQDAVNMGDTTKGNGAAKTTTQRHLKFSSTSTASPAAFTTVSLPDSKPTTTAPAKPTGLVTAPGSGSSALPHPFDTGLGNNYTQPNCPIFINNFLRNDTFISCVPFSLLLQNSMSFFSATKSMQSITRTLDATCKVVEPACNSLLSSFASQLRQDANCGEDYRRQQPLVRSAYNGLISYEPLYKAGCERDEDGNYCFANAITNASSPTDSYPYYLPLGIALPGGSRPTCSTCLKNTMAIFNQAVNGKMQQPLAGDYLAAAQMINVGCGPGFANQTVAGGKGQSSLATKGLGKRSMGVWLGGFLGCIVLGWI
ncbi:MAG: hypothetical protein Q9219_000792 [cf. Caloplaca sp. 3 TL-2023]